MAVAKGRQKEAREVERAVAMKQYDDATDRKEETLPEEQCVYRVQVMKAFLRVGVPLAKLKYFRELVEEGVYRLTNTVTYVENGAIHSNPREGSSEKGGRGAVFCLLFLMEHLALGSFWLRYCASLMIISGFSSVLSR